MATTTTFDALATTRALEAAGMERRQAEAVAEAAAQAAGAGQGELVTKADFAAGLARLEARIYLALIGVVFAIIAADRLLP